MFSWGIWVLGWWILQYFESDRAENVHGCFVFFMPSHFNFWEDLVKFFVVVILLGFLGVVDFVDINFVDVVDDTEEIVDTILFVLDI